MSLIIKCIYIIIVGITTMKNSKKEFVTPVLKYTDQNSKRYEVVYASRV